MITKWLFTNQTKKKNFNLIKTFEKFITQTDWYFGNLEFGAVSAYELDITELYWTHTKINMHGLIIGALCWYWCIVSKVTILTSWTHLRKTLIFAAKYQKPNYYLVNVFQEALHFINFYIKCTSKYPLFNIILWK